MRVHHRKVTLNTGGLTDDTRPALVRFGRRGTGVVMQAHHIETITDPVSGLLLFNPKQIFTQSTAFLGFGTPNTYLVVPSKDGSMNKLSAFMFWRERAVVVTGKRFQAGVLFELVELPENKLQDIRDAMHSVEGQRSASCAHLNAAALTAAGFTFGNGRSLSKGVYRPSKLASLLWRHGLAYADEAGISHTVELRVIHATPKPFGDHFVGVWMREVDSLKRTVQKQYAKRRNRPIIQREEFEEQPFPDLDTGRWHGPEVAVGMATSNRIGVNTAFLIGQKPSYVVKLPGLDLGTPLPPFPVIRDKVTWLKRHILFSRPVIRSLNKARLAGIDWYEGFRAGTVIDMLAPSESADYANATLYNCVVTPYEARITGLHTKEARNMQSGFIRKIDWVAAKHVLLSNYNPEVVFACELWVYRDVDGVPVLCLNNNSGTYKPSVERMEAFATYLRETFEIRVRTFPM